MSYYYGKKKVLPPPKHQASPLRAGHDAGRHDESQPYYSGNLTQKQTKGHYRPARKLEPLQASLDEMEAAIDGNGDTWPPRMPASVYRYNNPLPSGGNVRYEFHPDEMLTNPHIPRRSSAAA